MSIKEQILLLVQQLDTNTCNRILWQCFLQLIEECSEVLRMQVLQQVQRTIQWRTPQSFIVQSICVFLDMTSVLLMYRINHYWHRQMHNLPAAWQSLQIRCDDTQTSWNKWRTSRISAFITQLSIGFPRPKPPCTTRVLKNILHQECVVKKMKQIRTLVVRNSIESQYELECVALLLEKLPQLTAVHLTQITKSFHLYLGANVRHLSCHDNFHRIQTNLPFAQLRSLCIQGMPDPKHLIPYLSNAQCRLRDLRIANWSSEAFPQEEWRTVLESVGRLKLATFHLNSFHAITREVEIWKSLVEHGLSDTLVDLSLTMHQGFPYELACPAVVFPRVIRLFLPLNDTRSCAAIVRMFPNVVHLELHCIDHPITALTVQCLAEFNALKYLQSLTVPCWPNRLMRRRYESTVWNKQLKEMLQLCL